MIPLYPLVYNQIVEQLRPITVSKSPKRERPKSLPSSTPSTNGEPCQTTWKDGSSSSYHAQYYHAQYEQFSPKIRSLCFEQECESHSSKIAVKSCLTRQRSSQSKEELFTTGERPKDPKGRYQYQSPWSPSHSQALIRSPKRTTKAILKKVNQSIPERHPLNLRTEGKLL